MCGDGLVRSAPSNPDDVELCDDGEDNADGAYGGCQTDCLPNRSSMAQLGSRLARTTDLPRNTRRHSTGATRRWDNRSDGLADIHYGEP